MKIENLPVPDHCDGVIMAIGLDATKIFKYYCNPWRNLAEMQNSVHKPKVSTIFLLRHKPISTKLFKTNGKNYLSSDAAKITTRDADLIRV